MTLKVLVANDHAVNRLLLRTLFESFGCAVATVAGGAEALRIEEDFDLICGGLDLAGPSAQRL